MVSVASRELRNNTRSLLERAGAGEEIVITVEGRSIATLQSVSPGRTWLPKAAFVALLANQADPGLTAELWDLAPDSTDDLPFD